MWVYLISISLGFKLSAFSVAVLSLLVAVPASIVGSEGDANMALWGRRFAIVALVAGLVFVLTPTGKGLVDGSATLCRLTTDVCAP